MSPTESRAEDFESSFMKRGQEQPHHDDMTACLARGSFHCSHGIMIRRQKEINRTAREGLAMQEPVVTGVPWIGTATAS